MYGSDVRNQNARKDSKFLKYIVVDVVKNILLNCTLNTKRTVLFGASHASK